MVDRLARVGVNVITDLESFSTGGLCLSFGIGFKDLYMVIFQSFCISSSVSQVFTRNAFCTINVVWSLY